MLSKLLNFFSIRDDRKDELESFDKTLQELKDSAKKMPKEEKAMLTNFLQFGSKTVQQVMIPRSDIFAIDDKTDFEEVQRLIIDNVHTRTLVYKENLDNIVGFLHLKDLLVVITNKDRDYHKILRKPLVVAPSMKLIDLLAQMQHKRTHIAIVLDEYGGTDGMVTIEDIIEKIVGRIDDEHDIDGETTHAQLAPGTFMLSGRAKIEDVEQLLGVKLKTEEDEFETINGFILAKVGQMPKANSVVWLSQRIEVRILEVSPRMIKKVKLIAHQEQGKDGATLT